MHVIIYFQFVPFLRIDYADSQLIDDINDGDNVGQTIKFTNHPSDNDEDEDETEVRVHTP